MDPRLLPTYLDELRYLTASFEAFSRNHPKIARRLGAQAGDVGDAYVEKLLQRAAFTYAGLRLSIDDAHPRLPQELLRRAYPNYITPTPSISVARLFPSAQNNRLITGYCVPRGTIFTAREGDGETTSCRFSTSQDVTLWPLDIYEAKLTGVPPDIPEVARYMPPEVVPKAALRLRLRTTDGSMVSTLQGLDRLPIYLAGDERTASHLFELIHTSAHATIMGRPGAFAQGAHYAVTQDAVTHEGLAPEQSVLPRVKSGFHGHNLLHEYFVCPARFWFFALTGLAKGLAQLHAPEVEIVILLGRDASDLEAEVDAKQFALFCTPIINLFPLRIDYLKLPPRGNEVQVVADVATPDDYELIYVTRVIGQETLESEAVPIPALYDSPSLDQDKQACYFTLRHELHEDDKTNRTHATLSPFTVTRHFLALVDVHGQPIELDDSDPMRYVSFDAWMSNRNLPLLTAYNGRDDLEPGNSSPIASIGIIRTPSAPREPLAQGERAWAFVSQLVIPYHLFDGRVPDRPPGEGLRRRLRPFLAPEATALLAQVEHLNGIELRPINRVIVDGMARVARRCMEITLTFDEAGFDGISPYTFGLALEHYLTRYVSNVSCTEVLLHTPQRGQIAHYPPRAGTKPR